MTTAVDTQDLYRYALRMGDSTLILAQRFCEKVGTAPILEEEIAQANIALDTLGQATAWLELAAKWQGEGKTADDLAYWRVDRDFTNYLITELENGDFARIVVRGFLFTSFTQLVYHHLQQSTVPELVALAIKSSKELDYHVQHLGDWVERLGLGTEESNRRMREAVNYVWAYTQELFDQDDLENRLSEAGVVPNKAELQQEWQDFVLPFLERCDLQVPECKYFYDGGTKGMHTEELGYILAEMQSVTRQHPDGVW
ncbi:MAG: phenylacetate-CoA oxygenase subunit PaaI [Gammaproteobacteria bacterium]|nr:MAG: phenylacetate-CoA oxygenase subunit PaaI [Gammaproteobacteria bacterium]